MPRWRSLCCESRHWWREQPRQGVHADSGTGLSHDCSLQFHGASCPPSGQCHTRGAGCRASSRDFELVESNKAVFLSYAKQDAEAAARICDALRAAGIEVWFDQSELRGGDAWDAAIRRQIKTCALMIPVISANTQGRAEGYFRLEWKLAVDRSHLMSQDRAFLLPVVIDQTSEGDERVPERFREVQWTRLPGGETSPAFVARILRLLEQESPAASAPTAPPVFAAPAPAANPIPAAAAAPAAIKRRTPLAWIGVMAVLLCMGIAAWATRSTWLRPPTVVAYSNEDRRMTFALLPFHAPADDAHALQIAKATGDEILTLLETRKELVSVAPRGSVEQAVARDVSMKKLAKALDVHFLIRGTVAARCGHYTVTVLGDRRRQRASVGNPIGDGGAECLDAPLAQ